MFICGCDSAKGHNASAHAPSHVLEPILVGGAAPTDFPKAIQDLMNLKDKQLDALLRAYNITGKPGSAGKRNALADHIGVRTTVL